MALGWNWLSAIGVADPVRRTLSRDVRNRRVRYRRDRTLVLHLGADMTAVQRDEAAAAAPLDGHGTS
ncbi:MAG TPA: hypothetical protein VJ770_14810 [Stellaceae bacterium]|nr:hypothetical protein [Stellaceae bacterium]